MKKSEGYLIICLFSVVIACTNTKNATNNADTSGTVMDTSRTSGSSEMAVATITATKSDTSGSGRAEFKKQNNNSIELNLSLNFPKMANRSVAVHLHEHGDCSDEGKGAHGHWNPTNEPHGKWGSAAFHSGDIGNVQLDAKGAGSISISTDRWSIGGDDKTNILNRAVIVHSGVDDYTTQPTGNAGSRIGCGVISSQ
jgi:Cu-Zn family superoxide dismutase